MEKVNNAYSPNAHLLDILMHYNSDIIKHNYFNHLSKLNYTNQSVGGEPFEQTNYMYPKIICVQYQRILLSIFKEEEFCIKFAMFKFSLAINPLTALLTKCDHK